MNTTITTIRRAALLCALGCALAQPALAADDNAKHRRVAPPSVQRIAPPARHMAAPMYRATPPMRIAAQPMRPVARTPVQRWQPGHWVPPHARRPVRDWRAHRLPPPAWGHQWIHTGHGYAHIALSTGLITLVING